MAGLNRRHLLLATGASLSRLPQAFGDEFFDGPIHFVVPFAPGAGADRTARIMADRLAPMLGQPIVVENRGGASGEIGTRFVVRSKPDGQTWLLGHDPPLTINQHLRHVPYDALHELTAVSLLTHVPLFLATNPQLEANTVPELIKLAQAKPGQITFASSGYGTSAHLAGAMLMFATKTKMLHVPFKGQADAVTDVLAGRIDFTFTAIGDIQGLVKAGSLKVLAVGSPKRFAGLPDIPGFAEYGYPDFDASAFHAILMPAKVPAAVVSRVNGAVDTVMKMPEVASHFERLGLVPVGGKPEQLAELLRSDTERWATIIRESHMSAE